MKKQAAPESPKKYLSKSRFQHSLCVESYGVKIRINSNEIAAIDTIRDLMPSILADRYQLVDDLEPEHEFHYSWNTRERDTFYKNGQLVISRREREVVLDQLSAQIRLTVAEFANEYVFVHAGVVGWNGKAIVMPAKSFGGKSTLTAELVRLGALYYSDEYAVFDKDGMVSPFPKHISLRDGPDEFAQTDYPVENFGGSSGTDPIPVAIVLITKYRKNGKWSPVLLSNGDGLMEIIRNTIPIRNAPGFTLSVLNKATQNATILKTNRGEATEASLSIIEYFAEEFGGGIAKSKTDRSKMQLADRV